MLLIEGENWASDPHRYNFVRPYVFPIWQLVHCAPTTTIAPQSLLITFYKIPTKGNDFYQQLLCITDEGLDLPKAFDDTASVTKCIFVIFSIQRLK